MNHIGRFLKIVGKTLLALTCIAVGGALVIVLIAAGVVSSPSARTKILQKAVVIANEKTDYDIDLDRLYLSPFHHSPMVLYRAYKGETDLPLQVEIDSLFVGHRGQDTLVYIRSLRLRADALAQDYDSALNNPPFALPLVRVDTLALRDVTFHSGDLIASVGVDAVVGLLSVRSPLVSIADGSYPLHGLKLSDAFCGIDLRPQPMPDTVPPGEPMKMAFDLPDGELQNIHFRLTPLGMDIRTGRLDANAMVDVGANCYDAKRIDVGRFVFELGNLRIPLDTVYGNACADIAHNLITSRGLHARSGELGAEADLTATTMDLNSMRVEAAGDALFQGSKASLRASYDIDDEAYDASIRIDRVNLSPFLKDSTRIVLAGDIAAQGKGINPSKPLRTHVRMHLKDAIYDTYDLSGIDLSFDTDTATSLALATRGLTADIQSPMPVMALVDQILPLVRLVSDSAVVGGLTSLQDLTMLDTIRRQIPALKADIALRKGSPVQRFIDSTGIDLRALDLALRSDSSRTDIAVEAATNELPGAKEKRTALRLPAAEAALKVGMEEGHTTASLTASTRLTDGAMTFEGLCTDAGLRLDLDRAGNALSGTGQLKLDSLSYLTKEFGSRTIDISIDPSDEYAHALRAGVQLEDLPLSLVNSFVSLPDIDLQGAIRASAQVDGLPRKTDISAEVLPLGVAATYSGLADSDSSSFDPSQLITVSLGETPIIMAHNKVDLNGLPLYGADSTYIALTGGLDLDSMRLHVVLEADSFAPIKLEKGGPLPVHGELATAIHGTVSGPLDSIVADIDLTILPTTDITYPIDKKNLAQVKPYGTVNARYSVADAGLALGGQINVDEGLVRYSPKLYPVMPFHVDSGSHVSFAGPIDKTYLDISASQHIKADVEAEGEDTRRVDFNTGVRLRGSLDSIGIRSIGFFLEAPDDEPVTRELESLDEDTREGLAATLLATGMYVGESNVAAQREGYALSSILNSRINAALANSKVGKFVDIDFSSAQTSRATGDTKDMNIAISKSFFKDRLRLTIGSTITDNPEVNNATGLLSSLTADYRILPSVKKPDINSALSLRLYSVRDYNNVLEGELYKSGLSIHATKDWTNKHSLAADAGVAYRSNNSLGPDLTLKYTLKNLLGHGESLQLKGNGAYYWALRNRHPGDPKKTDTYKLGLNASLLFPYLHWAGDNNPEGDTRYMLGYQYENIAGGYGVHKLSGSFTYFFHSVHNPYITHAFTPFSLSVVLMKAEAADLLDKAAEYPQLIKVIAGDEFVPSIGYNFIYNNYRSNRPVNTMLDLGIKESGNLINALYCAFGYKWSDQYKPLGKITFNQFVKLSAELRNKFNLTDKVSIATRLFAGANIPLGNSTFAPLSEAFYAGGPNSLRASAPYAYGPGNFYSAKYNQNFFHAGDVKLEANFELRFPIVWKLFGAAFVDAGNIWNWYSTVDLFKAAGYEDYLARLEIPTNLYDGLFGNPEFAKQIALGTGAGLRLDLDGLVVRLDIGVAIHAPFQTYRYDKSGKPDMTQPITTYYNIPSAFDAIRVNFGIGYPF